MPVGEAQAAFGTAAARDGLVLVAAKVPWINQRGHYGLPAEAREAVDPLEEIFTFLGGKPEEQRAKRLTALPGDFFHAESGTFIETDEVQHFTSFRSRSLELYPDSAPIGFGMREYRALCHEMSPVADRYRAAKDAKGFGMGGRQRQRAYNDALRDLVIPAMGFPPVLRVPVLAGDGEAAYKLHRDRILAAVHG